jgi:hypothetical protein
MVPGCHSALLLCNRAERLGVIFLPMLCFLSGPRFTNSFGKPPLPSGALKVVAALVSFLMALVLVPLVASLYAPLHLQSTF